MSARWVSPRLVRRTGAVALVVVCAISLILGWQSPRVIHEKALPENLPWQAQLITETEPASIVLVGKLNGLSEIWVRQAGPAAAGSVIGVLRPAGGTWTQESVGEPVARGDQQFWRFVFPPVAGSAGQRFSFELRPRPNDPSGLPVTVAQAPGRFYPADDSSRSRQVSFELAYSTTQGDALLSLADRLGGVTGERWAPAPLFLVLAIIQAGFVAALFGLVWRAWSWS